VKDRYILTEVGADGSIHRRYAFVFNPHPIRTPQPGENDIIQKAQQKRDRRQVRNIRNYMRSKK